jgi:hypothetical protein
MLKKKVFRSMGKMGRKIREGKYGKEKMGGIF